MLAVHELDHRPTGGHHGAGRNPELGEIEDPLSGKGRGQGLTGDGFPVPAEARRQLLQLFGGPGAGPSPDRRPFAGEHGSQNRARVAESAYQGFLGYKGAIEENLVEVVRARHLAQRSNLDSGLPHAHE